MFIFLRKYLHFKRLILYTCQFMNEIFEELTINSYEFNLLYMQVYR